MKKNIPWWEVQVGDEEQHLVSKVLESAYLNEGDLTTQFESRIASLLGAKHAVATTSGTTALFMSLAACGIGHGDEVIVPDVTFIAS